MRKLKLVFIYTSIFYVNELNSNYLRCVTYPHT